MQWSEAEAECQKEGGHLPSVTSEEKDKELKQVGSTIPGYGASFWLGGKQESGVLTWSDNSTWEFTNWDGSISDCHNSNGSSYVMDELDVPKPNLYGD